MKPRAIFLLLIGQMLIIFLGVVLTGSFVRIYEGRISQAFFPSAGYPYVKFVVSYGLWLSVLPLAWAAVALGHARQVARANASARRFELVGGLLLLGLLLVFAVSVIVGVGTLHAVYPVNSH